MPCLPGSHVHQGVAAPSLLGPTAPAAVVVLLGAVMGVNAILLGAASLPTSLSLTVKEVRGDLPICLHLFCLLTVGDGGPLSHALSGAWRHLLHRATRPCAAGQQCPRACAWRCMLRCANRLCRQQEGGAGAPCCLAPVHAPSALMAAAVQRQATLQGACPCLGHPCCQQLGPHLQGAGRQGEGKVAI